MACPRCGLVVALYILYEYFFCAALIRCFFFCFFFLMALPFCLFSWRRGFICLSCLGIERSLVAGFWRRVFLLRASGLGYGLRAGVLERTERTHVREIVVC